MVFHLKKESRGATGGASQQSIHQQCPVRTLKIEGGFLKVCGKKTPPCSMIKFTVLIKKLTTVKMGRRQGEGFESSSRDVRPVRNAAKILLKERCF